MSENPEGSHERFSKTFASSQHKYKTTQCISSYKHKSCTVLVTRLTAIENGLFLLRELIYRSKDVLKDEIWCPHRPFGRCYWFLRWITGNGACGSPSKRLCKIPRTRVLSWSSSTRVYDFVGANMSYGIFPQRGKKANSQRRNSAAVHAFETCALPGTAEWLTLAYFRKTFRYRHMTLLHNTHIILGYTCLVDRDFHSSRHTSRDIFTGVCSCTATHKEPQFLGIALYCLLQTTNRDPTVKTKP